MKTTIIIMVLMSMAWQIVSNLLEKAEKKRRLQQMEAARRQAGAPPTVQGSGASSQAPGAPPRAEKDDLASRRKAQLEELRRRRNAGSSAQRRPEAKPAYPAASSARLPQTQTIQQGRTPGSRSVATDSRGRQIKDLEGDMRSWHRRQEAEKGKHQEELRRHAESERAALEEEARRLAHERARAAQARQAAQQRGASQVDAATHSRTQSSGGLSAAGLQRAAHGPFTDLDRAALRRVFILKELLDPPLALRGE